MNKTTGVVISIYKLKWLRINTKALESMNIEATKYPHIIKVKYHVDGKEYIKRQYLGIWNDIPDIGAAIQIEFDENNPSKSNIIN